MEGAGVGAGAGAGATASSGGVGRFEHETRQTRTAATAVLDVERGAVTGVTRTRTTARRPRARLRIREARRSQDAMSAGYLTTLRTLTFTLSRPSTNRSSGITVRDQLWKASGPASLVCGLRASSVNAGSLGVT